jgi:hypothetical protein
LESGEHLAANRPIDELLLTDFDKSGTPDVLAFFSAERCATVPFSFRSSQLQQKTARRG